MSLLSPQYLQWVFKWSADLIPFLSPSANGSTRPSIVLPQHLCLHKAGQRCSVWTPIAEQNIDVQFLITERTPTAGLDDRGPMEKWEKEKFQKICNGGCLEAGGNNELATDGMIWRLPLSKLISYVHISQIHKHYYYVHLTLILSQRVKIKFSHQ